jgi:hypothetical protein
LHCTTANLVMALRFQETDHKENFSHKSIEQLEQDGMCPHMNILEFANHLNKLHGWIEMCKLFRTYGFTVKTPHFMKGTIYENMVRHIKYKETCFLWKPIWARQLRGTVLRLTADNIVVCDKMLLQRGAEVLTGYHVREDVIETQDTNITVGGTSKFDDVQQDTIKRLLSNDLIDGNVSFKHDGSLLGLSIYNPNSEAGLFYQQLIEDKGDVFSKMILAKTKNLGYPMIPIMSTQGTWFHFPEMHDYMVSSILVDLCGIPQEQLCKYATDHTPVEAFNEFGDMFITKLYLFYKQYEQNMCLSFEAVCNQRTTCWGEKHIEFAISYPETFIRFLGCSFFDTNCTSFVYKAHCQLEKELFSLFDQPLYWKIEHAKDIEIMMKSLTDTICKKITVDQFLAKHKPSNINPTPSKYLDYEGFIFYRAITGRNSYDYSKIKTVEYYKSHKFHDKNVPYLVQLGMFSPDIFPLAQIVLSMCNGLDVTLNQICQRIMDVLKSDILLETFGEKAKASFAKQKVEIQMKMLVNTSNPELLTDLFFECFVEYFPQLNQIKQVSQLNSDNLPIAEDIKVTSLPTMAIFGIIMKAIVMIVQPWKNDLETRTKELVNKLSQKYVVDKNPLKELIGVLCNMHPLIL